MMDDRGCWEWVASRLPRGYGKFARGWGQAGWSLAHRVSWEIHNGPIPEGVAVFHRCDNPPCVNPAHLYLGDAKQNMADYKERGNWYWHKGVAVHTAVLDEAKVKDIRELYAAGGVTMREIAQRFNCGYNTVNSLIHRRTWKHVE